MKDFLGQSAFWNMAPRNWTQTAYMRFLKGPSGEVKSQFTESQKAFEQFGKDSLKTRYTELWEE